MWVNIYNIFHVVRSTDSGFCVQNYMCFARNKNRVFADVCFCLINEILWNHMYKNTFFQSLLFRFFNSLSICRYWWMQGKIRKKTDHCSHKRSNSPNINNNPFENKDGEAFKRWNNHMTTEKAVVLLSFLPLSPRDSQKRTLYLLRNIGWKWKIKSS